MDWQCEVNFKNIFLLVFAFFVFFRGKFLVWRPHTGHERGHTFSVPCHFPPNFRHSQFQCAMNLQYPRHFSEIMNLPWAGIATSFCALRNECRFVSVPPMHDGQYWIQTLGLEKHPEGGYFRRVYESKTRIDGAALTPARPGTRHAATGIYYLLQNTDCSRFHRLNAEELWHFHAGSGLTLHMLHADGTISQRRLGPDPDAGQAFQAMVSPNTWFGATLDNPASYALVGCTVVPGFEYADFELADRNTLLRQHPGQRKIILRLT